MTQKRVGFLFTFTKFYVTVYNIANGNVSQISLRLHDVRTASQLAYIVKRVVFLRYRPSYLRQKGDETRTGEKACHSLTMMAALVRLFICDVGRGAAWHRV
jgi:hypothetical protein